MNFGTFAKLMPVLVLGCAQSALASSDDITFRVKVQNVMAANGLSPFFAAVLNSDRGLFQIGMPASAGIASIAELGRTDLLEEELASNSIKVTTAKAAGGPLMSGETRSVDIVVSKEALSKGALLNVVSMIGKSNDSFIALRNVKLANIPMMGCYSFLATNYDAGSEENTGNVEDFGPGGHPVEHAEGKVSVDRGLNPRGNAPDLFAWGQTAAIVSIERVH